jgi:hypothetical protein
MKKNFSQNLRGQMETNFQDVPEYMDTTGRTVQPVQPGLSLNDYTNAWKRYCTLLPNSMTSRGRHMLRNCVEEALGCPEHLTYAVGNICQSGIRGSQPRQYVSVHLSQYYFLTREL